LRACRTGPTTTLSLKESSTPDDLDNRDGAGELEVEGICRDADEREAGRGSEMLPTFFRVASCGCELSFGDVRRRFSFDGIQ